MSGDARAVLFDLDDTLYPQRRFVLSGFAACARHLADAGHVEVRHAFRVLLAAWKGPRRGRELQACVEQFGLTESMVAELLEVMRGHPPSLRLPRGSASALSMLRPDWRLGIVTNGMPDVQRRKVAALGVGELVDTVVFANEHGTGLGKPDPAPFLEALTRLGVPADRAVFVGNDEACDIAGARAVGMRAIHAASMFDVPRIAETIARSPRSQHVA
jgi:putative hydrolase of the HAD superfamily